LKAYGTKDNEVFFVDRKWDAKSEHMCWELFWGYKKIETLPNVKKEVQNKSVSYKKAKIQKGCVSLGGVGVGDSICWLGRAQPFICGITRMTNMILRILDNYGVIYFKEKGK